MRILHHAPILAIILLIAFSANGLAQLEEYTWPFTNSANYTLSNTSEIQVTGGEASLLSLTGETITYNFSNTSEYIYNKTLINISNGAAKLNWLQNESVYAHWHLNASTGTQANDSSGNGYNGNLTNMENADWISAKLGRGLIFDGIDEYVTFGDIADFERTQAFSIEFWFKTATSGTEMIISKQQNSGVYRGYNVFIESGLLKVMLVSDNSGANRIFKATTSTYNDNAFHHVVVTYAGTSAASGLLIYVDGSTVSTTTITDALSATILNNVPLQISGREGGNVVLNGTVDEVVIYNKAITAAQVLTRYNSNNGIERPIGSYSETNPTIETNITEAFSTLNSFTKNTTESSATITYILSNDSGSTWYYYTGGAWTISSETYSESTTSTDMINNIATFGGPGNLRVRMFMHSNTGTATPIMYNIEFDQNATYSTTQPYITNIYPANFTNPISIFIETSTILAGTNITYKLSADNGTTWKWYNGTAWATTNGTNTTEVNNASTINTYINSFSGSPLFSFRAFLGSSGTSSPSLDSIYVNITELALQVTLALTPSSTNPSTSYTANGTASYTNGTVFTGTVTLWQNFSTNIGNATPNASGYYSISLTAPAASGTYTITANVTDGTRSGSANATLTVPCYDNTFTVYACVNSSSMVTWTYSSCDLAHNTTESYQACAFGCETNTQACRDAGPLVDLQSNHLATIGGVIAVFLVGFIFLSRKHDTIRFLLLMLAFMMIIALLGSTVTINEELNVLGSSGSIITVLIYAVGGVVTIIIAYFFMMILKSVVEQIGKRRGRDGTEL